MTQSNEQTSATPFGEVIHTYTRKQAIEDGVLIDVTDMAREAGFRWPVAVTAAIWADCVAWSEEDNARQIYQDESGRLWDLLFVATYAVQTARKDNNPLKYDIWRVPRDGRSTDSQLITLKLIAGPGDDGEPVITIMQPHED
jgi:hypothetical protein